jgi:hypothetical protein
MSAKLYRRVAVGACLILVLFVGVWYFGVWSVRRTFEETHFDGLSNLLEASAGRSLANADSQVELVQPGSSAGILGFYQSHADEMKKDKALFQTWSIALRMADSALERSGLSEWQSSESVSWILPGERADAWRHPFCLKADQGVSVVVSAGPQALAPLTCDKIALSSDQLSSFKQGRLNRHPSGALILVVRRRAT